MPKMYSEFSRLDHVNKNMVPKKETLQFLLDYSRALKIMEGKNLKYETILN